MTGWDGPRGTTLTCLRGAFRLMENTHHALWVKRLQTSTPIIIILTMQAEFLKSSRTTSLLINSHPNSSSNIHTLWHEEPLKTQLALSGWGFPLWGGVNEGGVSVVMMHIYSLLHKAISHVTIWSLIWNNPPNHFRDFFGGTFDLVVHARGQANAGSSRDFPSMVSKSQRSVFNHRVQTVPGVLKAFCIWCVLFHCLNWGCLHFIYLINLSTNWF